MKPIWAIVEYASIRFRFVCAIAARLPSSIDASESSTSICCQSIARPIIPSTRRRIVIAKAASLGAPPTSSVIDVGAPW